MCIKWEFIPTTQFVIVNEVSIIQGVQYSTVLILIDLHVLNMTFVMLFGKTTHVVLKTLKNYCVYVVAMRPFCT